MSFAKSFSSPLYEAMGTRLLRSVNVSKVVGLAFPLLRGRLALPRFHGLPAFRPRHHLPFSLPPSLRG